LACAVATTTVENAATQAVNATNLICLLILKNYSLLQSTYGDDQLGSFENFHQLVEYALIVLRARLKIFLQYALRFANGLKS
jgi:hypothetical protein